MIIEKYKIPENVLYWYFNDFSGTIRSILKDRIEDEEDIDGIISQIYYEVILNE